jgi:hypothetical protein
MPMFSHHPRVLCHKNLIKIQNSPSMKTSGPDVHTGTGNIHHRRTAFSGTPGYCDPSSISVRKILDCTQQPFMVVAKELCCSVFPVIGHREFSILSSQVEGKIAIRNALITSLNLNHEPS